MLEEIFAGRINKNVAKRLPKLTARQLDELAEWAVGGEPITDDAVSEAMRTQYGAISVPLTDALDAFDIDGGEAYGAGTIEDRDEAAAAAPAPRSKTYAATAKALRALLKDAGLPGQVRALATALLSEVE